MTRAAIVLAVLAVATPATAQYDPAAEAQRRRAELDRWGAAADAQAAEAARSRAETRLRLREIEIQRSKGRSPGQTLEDETWLRVDRLDVQAADRQSDDARQRELDAKLREIDSFLDSASRPKR